MVSYRARRVISAVLAVLFVSIWVLLNPSSYDTSVIPVTSAHETSEKTEQNSTSKNSETSANSTSSALEILEKLKIKGRAPKTGYKRDEFYSSWPTVDGCSLRQRIIKRELGDSAVLATDNCTVVSGEFDEPYTGSHLVFYEKSDFSKGIQIDHVVALSDAWQKGAQNLSKEMRYSLATDPLNLLAVDASTNQGKSDGDAATWLPPNKSFRCEYVARQISVKYKYGLWVSDAEHDAMSRVLLVCPNQPAIVD